MKKTLPIELVFQVAALVASVIIVHLMYQTIVRPNATAALQERAALIEQQGDLYEEDRSFYVVVKDYEQESCFILMLWALSIMGFKARRIFREQALLGHEFIPVSDGVNILPEDTRTYTRPLQALAEETQKALLPRALLVALNRFASTRNIQDVSDAVGSICENESDRLDSELAMIRYIAWAIPSIGFIGTVRGISDALGQAYRAVEGDIAGVTTSLGVAFNSTFIALVISIILMFFMHQLQLLQERLVLDTHDYCDEKLLRYLRSQG